MPTVYDGPDDSSHAPSLYAPTTSRFGTDDPLGRTTSIAPVVSFGLGGKLLTCFSMPSSSIPGLAKPGARAVYFRSLNQVIPSSALESSSTPFPGPLFGDPASGSLTGGFSRGNTSTAAKSKKAAVTKYLEERATEIEGGLAYLATGPEHEADRRSAEGKLLLVRLLKILVDNDGKLSGGAGIDKAVRAVLVPSASEAPTSALEPRNLAAPSIPFMGSAAQMESSEEPLVTYNVRSSALERLQLLLLKGERREAVHFALDEKMWAHALVISSSIDKDAWKEAVSEFVRYELASQSDRAGGRESLRIAYSLYAGNGAASVQEILPPKSLMKNTGLNGLLSPGVPLISHITPMSPNFPQPALASNIPDQSLQKWREAAATILSNQSPGSSAALTQLGDYLIMNNWVEAAHVCYLLSPQTSAFGASGGTSVRMVLLGVGNPAKVPNFHRDLDSVRLSEVLEFGYSLATTAKGQDPFIGLSHLQPYRLLHALHLAEMGHTALATRYIESIQQTIKLAGAKANQLYAQSLLVQMKDLQDRLTQAPQEAVGFWANKVPKPTLDGFGSWVGTNLTKFIAGEGETTAQNESQENKQDSTGAPIGPFSHYSAISSAVPSNDPSPHGSSTNLVGQSITPPARRAGSAMSMRHTAAPPFAAPIDRAASAMDRPRVRNESPPRMFSADATMSTFQQAGQSGISTFVPQVPLESEATASDGWWNASSVDEQTPTRDTYHPDGAQPVDSGEFISLMDSVTPTPMVSQPASQPRSPVGFDNDDDDLGFGNSKARSNDDGPSENKEQKEGKKAEPPADKKPTNKPSGWFGGWFGGAKKEAEIPGGPVKANLGEQSSFYYDKEQKRWVNKAAGSSAESPKPATPPPRAQTTSPGGGRPPRSSLDMGSSSLPTSPAVNGTVVRHPPPGAAGGPPRSMSAVPPRMRSNLAESFTPVSDDGSTPPPPTSTPPVPTGTPPAGGPPSRPSSRAPGAKKNVRSRYVDVFKDQA
ncbi:hypothetical protein CALVIDRAFT_483144 [Calocera viscosa TUFC12733]|uniref:Protein transport protein sec16 n=1 Tax=Calocera viscosa (strain TUFC12733) TaxID=1330018 RepID=A0A167L3B3_CALVF|nr:hypothetical protein CALVIDRAFT_483144 [Calocera viscosa TUFC12733]